MCIKLNGNHSAIADWIFQNMFHLFIIGKDINPRLLCPFCSPQETQVPHLVKAGFREEDISTEIVPMSPPEECKYYQFHQMIAPTVLKQEDEDK